MNRRCHHPIALLLALTLGAASAAAPAASPGALPDDSVYRVAPLTLRDQDGKTFTFASLRGQPRLVGMFYGSCKMVCPVQIETLKRIQREVAGKATVSVVMISFDPARDDVAMLHEVAQEHHVAAPQFRLSRPESGDEGMLAGVLGIAYRKLPQGVFSHNALASLLDADGRIVAQADVSQAPDPTFVKAVVEAAKSEPGS